MRAFSIFQQMAAYRVDRGAAMAEYGLLLTGIAVVVGVAVGTFGQDLDTMFGAVLSFF